MYPFHQVPSYVSDVMHQGRHLRTSRRSWRAAAQRGPHPSWLAHPTRPAWVRPGSLRVHKEAARALQV